MVFCGKIIGTGSGRGHIVMAGLVGVVVPVEGLARLCGLFRATPHPGASLCDRTRAEKSSFVHQLQCLRVFAGLNQKAEKVLQRNDRLICRQPVALNRPACDQRDDYRQPMLRRVFSEASPNALLEIRLRRNYAADAFPSSSIFPRQGLRR
ncbi:hypothetical protein SRHO_G00013040 [Serrasalmus rhombeus]